MRLEPICITDSGDERLSAYRQLNDPARRERLEAERGIFVAEGRLALEQLVGSPYPVVSVLVSPNRFELLGPLLANVAAPVYVAPREVLAATVGFDLHRGVVAVGRRIGRIDPVALLRAARVVMVLEGINDHENLGALFRNARALGVGAVVLDPTCADPLYRRSIRVSLGHVLRVPFARLVPWPAGLGELRAAGFATVALTPDPSAVPVGDVAFCWQAGAHLDAHADAHPKRHAPVHRLRRCAVCVDRSPGSRSCAICDGTTRPTSIALVIGAEGSGLSAATRAAADVEVRVPMAAGVDSLNVGTAAAIVLYQLGALERSRGDRLA